MKIIDTFKIACHNLWIRKLRTTLNLVGIVLSCVLLMCTFAATNGITQAIERFVSNSEYAKKFRIWPGYDRSVKPPEEVIKVKGEMSERRRDRIRRILEDAWRQEHQRQSYYIPPSKIDSYRKMEHVVDVTPDYSFRSDAVIGDRTEVCVVGSYSLFDKSLPERIIFGENISEKTIDQILVHEGLAYQLGYQSDADLKSLIGKSITLRFQNRGEAYSVFGRDFYRQSIQQQTRWKKIIEHFVSGKSLEELDSDSRNLILKLADKQQDQVIPKVELVERKFIVRGVYRHKDTVDAENILDRYTSGLDSILLHYSIIEKELNDLIPKEGVHKADIYADSYSGLKTVLPSVTQNGMRASAPTDTIDRIVDAVNRSKITVIAIVAIVLFISAVGISNTMIISLIERTEEIGIMKAVGARNRHVLSMVLMEGTVTGLIGGIASIVISLLVTTVGNEILRSYVAYRSTMNLKGSVFELEAWMIALGVGLSVGITTIAGIWPAWRASRLDPVVAMGQQ